MVELDGNELEATLRLRVERYLSERSPWLAPLSQSLALLPTRRPVYLFGGLLRDVLLEGADASPRDVDLVIGQTTLDEMELVFYPYIDRKTRFGGLQLIVAGTQVDIWPLDATWAFREQEIQSPTFADLTGTTFLNMEAVALELDVQSGHTGQLHDRGFFDAIRSRTVDINYEPNPSPALCVTRSLSLAARLDYKIGKRLGDYITRHLQAFSLDEIAAQHMAVGGCMKCSMSVLAEWQARFGAGVATAMTPVECQPVTP